MRRIQQALTFALLLLAIGCGGGGDDAPIISGSDKHHDAPGDDHEGGVDAATDDSPDASSAGDAGAGVNPLAPVIKFLAPIDTDDPNSDAVLKTPIVKVECQVTRSSLANAQPVDQSTVMIVAHYVDNPDKPAIELKSPVDAKADNVFGAEFNLASVPNGTVEFVCSAGDISKPAVVGTGTMHTLVDLGPTVEIVTPEDGESLALKIPVTVKFRVTAAPVGDGDRKAKPTNVKLVVSGEEVTFKEDKKDPGTYTTSIDFGDTSVFPMAPATAQLVVTAASSRTPDAPTRTAVSNIMLDSEPPKITITSPKNGSIVRGEVVLSVKVTDAAGIKPDSVVANINDDLHILKNWKIAGDVYSEQFDTRAFDPNLTQLNIVVKAEDRLGNKAQTKAELSHILYLDNQPPIVSLDPPTLREQKESNDDCSVAFDPVGPDATSDKETKSISSLYRAMIFDQSTLSPGANVIHIATVNPDTAVLFAQKDPSVPLLIDSARKKGQPPGPCDEIDAENSSMQSALKQLKPRGASYYSKDTPGFAEGELGCSVGPDTESPDWLCGSEMPRIIGFPLGGKDEPVIYGSGPYVNNTAGPACEGETWEIEPTLGEGWCCLAARAEDKIGNIGISKPLRVCLDDGNPDNGVPDCAPAGAPSCTDGCALPDDFPEGMILRVK